MKTIIYLIAMALMVAVLTQVLTGQLTFIFFGVWVFIWSLMVVEFVNSLRRKQKPEPDYKQLYFKARAKIKELEKLIEKTSNDVDDIFESSGVIYAKNKLLEAANKDLVHQKNALELEIEELKEKVDYFYNDGLKKDNENNRLTSKIVELTSEKKDLIDQVNGYRGAFKRHKKGA